MVTKAPHMLRAHLSCSNGKRSLQPESVDTMAELRSSRGCEHTCPAPPTCWSGAVGHQQFSVPSVTHALVFARAPLEDRQDVNRPVGNDVYLAPAAPEYARERRSLRHPRSDRSGGLRSDLRQEGIAKHPFPLFEFPLCTCRRPNSFRHNFLEVS